MILIFKLQPNTTATYQYLKSLADIDSNHKLLAEILAIGDIILVKEKFYCRTISKMKIVDFTFSIEASTII
jgi:hypothetical protein